jgi:dTDP-4-dehydrorhamnose 3,5-epimerase
LDHDEYFCLMKGRASVGLRDERPRSPTFGRWSLYSICEDDPVALMFPSGLVHGWYFHAESLHLQAVSQAYGDYAHHDNHRVHWLDPDLEIPWPVHEATTTELAGAAPSLAELRRRLFSDR